jgi:hypothetical protein
MVLNCPVELQISLLGRPPTLNTNDSTIARLVVGNYSEHLHNKCLESHEAQGYGSRELKHWTNDVFFT